MIGIVVPGGRETISQVHSTLLDKNYLTPLELAAVLDNQLVEVNEQTASNFLMNLDIPLDGEGSAQVVAEAVRLANISRG